MAVQIQLDVGSGYGSPGAHADAAASATVNARLTDVVGLVSIQWDISGTHDPGAAAPAITTSGNPVGEIATFTLPAGAGQAYGIRARIRHSSGLAETLETAVYVLYGNGRAPVFVGETLQRDATHGRIVDMNATISDLP